jgi:hypothetical protein
MRIRRLISYFYVFCIILQVRYEQGTNAEWIFPGLERLSRRYRAQPLHVPSYFHLSLPNDDMYGNPCLGRSLHPPRIRRSPQGSMWYFAKRLMPTSSTSRSSSASHNDGWARQLSSARFNVWPSPCRAAQGGAWPSMLCLHISCPRL